MAIAVRELPVSAHMSGQLEQARKDRHRPAHAEEETRGFASSLASWFSTPAIVDAVTSQGWTDHQEVGEIRHAWLEWGAERGAFFAGFWCEAIAWAS